MQKTQKIALALHNFTVVATSVWKSVLPTEYELVKFATTYKL